MGHGGCAMMTSIFFRFKKNRTWTITYIHGGTFNPIDARVCVCLYIYIYILYTHTHARFDIVLCVPQTRGLEILAAVEEHKARPVLTKEPVEGIL